MKRGSVCSVHNEFSPDGVCRWCPTPPSEVPKRSFAELPLPPGAFMMPPILVASCKHDGVLYDYGGTTSCAACGKILSPLATAVRRIGASAMDVGFEPVTYMGCTEWRGSICAAPASTGCPLCGSARCPEHPYVRHNKGCPHWKAP